MSNYPKPEKWQDIPSFILEDILSEVDDLNFGYYISKRELISEICNNPDMYLLGNAGYRIEEFWKNYSQEQWNNLLKQKKQQIERQMDFFLC